MVSLIASLDCLPHQARLHASPEVLEAMSGATEGYVPSELRQLIERARLLAAARRWLRPAPGHSHSQEAQPGQQSAAVGGAKAAAALGKAAVAETEEEEEEDLAGDLDGDLDGDFDGDVDGDLELCLADAAEALPHVTARVRSPAAAVAAAAAMLEAGGAGASAAGAGAGGAGLRAGWARVGSLEYPKRLLSEAVLLPRQHRALFASAPLRLTSGVLIGCPLITSDCL